MNQSVFASYTITHVLLYIAFILASLAHITLYTVWT